MVPNSSVIKKVMMVQRGWVSSSVYPDLNTTENKRAHHIPDRSTLTNLFCWLSWVRVDGCETHTDQTNNKQGQGEGGERQGKGQRKKEGWERERERERERFCMVWSGLVRSGLVFMSVVVSGLWPCICLFSCLVLSGLVWSGLVLWSSQVWSSLV